MYWVGLVDSMGQCDSDLREYVGVDIDEDDGLKIQAAMLRLVQQLTNMQPGWSIKVILDEDDERKPDGTPKQD